MIDLTKRPLIISGPCSAETREQTIETCKLLAQSKKVDLLRAGAWKPRTKPGLFEGVGEIGLEWLCEAREITGLPISTEVASAKHVEKALDIGVDVVWIGARTTVNPFIVQDIADAVKGSNISVMVKNAINPDLGLWIGAIERFQKCGITSIAAIHRGFSIYGNNYYRNSPMWHIALEFKRLMPEIPMICDPSHISGNRDLIFEMAQKSADLNYSGLIIESHISPDDALSDSAQQITPYQLVDMLERIIWRDDIIDNNDFRNTVEQLRSQIDTIDDDILSLITKRMTISDRIGEVKRQNNVSILQVARWENIRSDRLQKALGMGLSRDFIIALMEIVHLESINKQNKIMNK